MGGAEKSLISFLNILDSQKLTMNHIKIFLLVADMSGELTSQVPDYVEIIETPISYKNFVARLSDLIKENPFAIMTIFKKLIWRYNSSKSRDDLSENEIYWKENNKYVTQLPGEYDYVFAYMNGTPTYFASDKVNGKVKYFWVHNEYEKLGYNDNFQRKFFDQADKLITISDRCADSLKHAFPEFAHKVEVIENISSKQLIDFQSLQNTPEEIDEHEFNVLSIGRLVEQKGYDIGIESVRLLKEKGINLKWYILGEGDKRLELEQQIKQAKLEETVYLLGNRDNPYAYLRLADVFFQPSRYEGKSIALDEAKIMCKPILVSNYATVVDSIEQGISGIICNLDGQSIATGLETIFHDESLRNKLTLNLSMMKSSNESEVEKYYKLLGL